MDTCPKNHERFVDADKCFNLIKDLKSKLDSNDSNNDDNKRHAEAEKLVETFKRVIDPYQEQPELLDPYLNDLINGLTSGLDDFNISSSRYHTVFKFLYQLIKVSGFKSIWKKFPHEADKLPLLTELLSKEDPQDRNNWQTRYVLTVWLSVVILAPFDLNKFDSDSTEESISERLYSILTRSLNLHDSCQQVTAYCLAKFFSRPDVIKADEHVSKFVSEALNALSQVKLNLATSMDDVQLIGYLRTLAYMFKFLPRAEMKKRCDAILDVLVKSDIEKINRELVNHLIIKLAQRTGLALLPKRVATWRYKRGSRILGQISNKESTTTKPASEQIAKETLHVDEEEEICSAESIESILGILFVAARNSQTRVRWSASKGIARLASRLSRERASDVIDMVMQSFFDEKTSNEYAWHAGCLTLAEMCRNGLVLEEKLEEVTRIIGNAIIYDKIKGSFAVGTHVRESACYVCWALAHTYEEHLLKPYISSISLNLLCTMLFDRELQCRRAASATFQELVGRQGTFNKETINILTNVDYQNAGSRQSTYLHLALQVASYGEKYSKPFVEHLIEKKIGHWDVQIRRLASDSLSALMLHSDHQYIRDSVLPNLMKLSDQNVDNNAKHGAILSLAKVIRGLVPLAFNFEPELIDFVGRLVKKCEKQLKSKQQAPNFMEAIGFVVSSAEIAGFKYAENSEILKQWEEIALTALDNENATLRDIGSEALLTLYKTYYKNNKTEQDRLLTILNRSLSSLSENTRCGALRAMSKLSRVPSGEFQLDGGGEDNNSKPGSKIKLDADTPDIILMSLASYIAKETREKSQDLVFAQAKAEACEAFVNFVRDLDKNRLIVSTNLLQAGYDALLNKAQDYTFDKRGDIGVVVRRAAIKALQELTLYLLSIGLNSLFDFERVTLMMGKILQQAVSYNNSARELAATAFYRLIESNLPDLTIAHKKEIVSLFEHYKVDALFNWRDDSTPIFVNLLAYEEYRADLWIGLMPSVGQVSDMCAKQFRDALSDYIRSLSQSSSSSSTASSMERDLVFNSFLNTLEQKDLPDRLLTSGLVVVDYLLTEGLMNEIGTDLQERLVQFCWKSKQGADPKRLFSISRVLSSMLQFTRSVQRQSLQYCLTLLANGYAKVRHYTAEQLYLSIMTNQADLETELEAQSETLETCMELLSQTNWNDKLEEVKPVRDEICKLLKVDHKS